ncbi:MAG: hypothetical protein ACLBM4_06770 [Dolichospermum sp.]
MATPETGIFGLLQKVLQLTTKLVKNPNKAQETSRLILSDRIILISGSIIKVGLSNRRIVVETIEYINWGNW